MPKVIDILRLKHEAGLSHEKIGCAVGLSKGAVGKYVTLAKAVGITWPLPPSVDEAQLESLLLRGQDKPASKYAQPDFSLIHQGVFGPNRQFSALRTAPISHHSSVTSNQTLTGLHREASVLDDPVRRPTYAPLAVYSTATQRGCRR